MGENELLILLTLVESITADLAVYVGSAILGSVASIVLIGWRLYRRNRAMWEELNMASETTRLESIDDDIARQDRYFLGDPNDPSDPGLLRQMHSMEQKLDRVLQAVEEDDND